MGDKGTQYQSAYMARMSERQKLSSMGSGGGSYQYESSYMKKINDNPAPSVTRGQSFSSRSESPSVSKANTTSPMVKDQGRSSRGTSNQRENRIPSVTKTPSFGSNKGSSRQNSNLQSPPTVPVGDRIRMQLNGRQSIRTNIHPNETAAVPGYAGQPPSPAQTIDAILCEQSNADNGSREGMPSRSSSPFNYTQISRRLHHTNASPASSRSPPPVRRHGRGPSPERLSISTRPSIYSSSDENLGNRFNSMSMNDRSFSPPRSSRSRSISPPRSNMKPLSSSYRNNIGYAPSRDSISLSARKRLPHETRYESVRSAREYRPSASYRAAPFWTQVSVKVSSALLKAGKDRKYAEAAQIAIVTAGEDQYDTDQAALNFVASKASLAVIEAGGDANTAAVATVACLKANDNTPSTEEQIKMEIDKTVVDIKNKASLVAQTTFDGGAKAVNVLSTLASKGYEDLKSFSETSFRKYRVYQRQYMDDRQKYMLARRDISRRGKHRHRSYSRRYRDSRDDDTLSDDDRYRRRRGTPRGSSRSRHKWDSDESSVSHRRGRSRKGKSRMDKTSSSTFDSRSYSSTSTSSYSSRTGSSFSSSESSNTKETKDDKKSRTSKKGKLKAKYSKSSSYSSSH